MKQKYQLHILIFFILFSTHCLADSDKKLSIHEIRIMGNTSTAASIVLRYSPFHRGQTCDSLELKHKSDLFARALKRTLFFEQVRVWFRVQNKRVNILVYVSDAQFPYIINGGPVFFKFNQLNVKGDGNVSDITLGKNAFGFERLINRGKMRNWQLFSGVNWFQKNEYVFDSPEMNHVTGKYEHFRLHFGMSHIKGTTFVKKLSLGLERTVYYGLQKNDLSQLKKNGSFWMFGEVSLRMDSRDHIYFPGVGKFYELKLREGIQSDNISQNYAKLSLDMRHYFSITPNSVLFIRGFGGILKGNYPYQVLFQLNNLDGIRANDKTYLHGNVVLMNTYEWRQTVAEIRKFFNTRIVLALFFDGGWIDTKAAHLKLKSPRQAWGPSLRIQIPYPIYVTLNFAYGMNKDGQKFFFRVRHNL